MRDRGGSAQPADARPAQGVVGGGGTLPRRGEERRDPAALRSRYARRLARAQCVSPLRRRRRHHAGDRPRRLRSARPHDLGGADGLDSVLGGGGGQWRGALLGLPQLRLRRRLAQPAALGPPDRRRGAAQQPPQLRHLGQAVGKVVRVRRRLDVHPHARAARVGQGEEDDPAAPIRRGQAGTRPRYLAGDRDPPLRRDDALRAIVARRLRRRGTAAARGARAGVERAPLAALGAGRRAAWAGRGAAQAAGTGGRGQPGAAYGGGDA